MHWIHNTVIYNIYPLGFCGAPKDNDFQLNYRLDKIRKISGLDLRKFHDAVIFSVIALIPQEQ